MIQYFKNIEHQAAEIDNNVKLVIIKTPAENNSFNESDAFYITIPGQNRLHSFYMPVL